MRPNKKLLGNTKMKTLTSCWPSHTFKPLCRSHLTVSFSSLGWPPSSASLSLSYIHVHCTAAVRRMKRLFRASLSYPAGNPLPSETLPFPFPDILTDMHTQTHANAQSIHNNREHLHTLCGPQIPFRASYTPEHEVCRYVFS